MSDSLGYWLGIVVGYGFGTYFELPTWTIGVIAVVCIVMMALEHPTDRPTRGGRHVDE